jgi:type I restriction enzyme S subunit
LVGNEEFYFKDGNLTWFKNFSKEIDSKFLYYWMLSEMFKKQIYNNKIGAVQKALTIVGLQDLKLDLPKLTTQSAIVRVLSSFDNKIELNNKINKELENLAKMIYDYWFVQFDFPNSKGKPYRASGGKMEYNKVLKREIPKGWEVKQLESIISFNRGISYTSADIKDENGLPMINLGSVDINRNYRPEQLKYYSGQYKQEDIVKSGDMLIACTDLTRNCDIIGSPIIVPEEFDKYLYSMDLAKINIIDKVSDMYIYERLRTDIYHNYIKYFASGTNVLHLDLNGINWYKLEFPPKYLQEQFSKVIGPLRNKQSKIISENQKFIQLRDFLLPLLMNGQVKISDKESKTDDVRSLKNQDYYNNRFEHWLQNQKIAARGKIDRQTLRAIFDAMDDNDK